MFDIIKSVISAGGYKLAEIQHKIKKLWIQGDLTEEQADELLILAQGGVSPDAERPEVLEMLRSLSARVDDLAAEVAALKTETDTTEPDTEATEYEAWTPWDGISDKYQPGYIVTHKGELWQSVYPGQNVWEPGTVEFWIPYDPEE